MYPVGFGTRSRAQARAESAAGTTHAEPISGYRCRQCIAIAAADGPFPPGFREWLVDASRDLEEVFDDDVYDSSSRFYVIWSLPRDSRPGIRFVPWSRLRLELRGGATLAGSHLRGHDTLSAALWCWRLCGPDGPLSQLPDLWL
jgi:hypothetical protein